MAVKRYRVIFSVNYSLNQLRKTTRSNLRRSLVYGMACGMAQGVLTAAAAGIAISHFPQLIAAPMIAFALHPVIVTPAMTCVTIGMIIKLKMVNATTARSLTLQSQPIYREFQKSSVAVCLFYVFSQVANCISMVLRGIDNEGHYIAAHIRAWFLNVNSTINFFIYLATSRRFRVELKSFGYRLAYLCKLPAGQPWPNFGKVVFFSDPGPV